MSDGKVVARYVGAFVDELVRCGVDQAVISPGSRSAPLAVLMAEHPGMNARLLIDERSAAFFALGMAKAQRKPVALVCSSGTAVANYLPAMVEAYQSRVPLLALTADRPHELREVGAPQTIDQLGVFGKFAKLFIEMAIPEDSPELLRYVRMVAARAAATAAIGPGGPVHLNFPFREPLLPDLDVAAFAAGSRAEQRSYTKVLAGSRNLEAHDTAKLAQELSGIQRGLIVCGPHDDPSLAAAVTQLADCLQYPVLADPLSQVRCGIHPKQWIIDTYDSFLRNPAVAERLAPQVVIRLGAMPVSKALTLYLKNAPGCRQIVVDADCGWREPTLTAMDMLYADPVLFCREMSRHLTSDRPATAQRTEWAEKWLYINRVSKKKLAEPGRGEAMFEGRIFLELGQLLPDGAALFAGNSMPVRDMDSFLFCQERKLRIFANRGANGIDGIVSSALGVAVSEQPLVLVIGDLSFYHDLNGLLAAKLHALQATIILVNNDGGGIFSFLPQAQLPRHFEEVFGTPVGLDFKAAVEMYQGKFTRVDCWETFRQAVQDSFITGGLQVIELITQRDVNVKLHREIWQAVSAEVGAYLATNG